LEPVQREFHQGLLDWHLRRSWDVHLEFGGRFPVGKVAARDFFVLVYGLLKSFTDRKSNRVCINVKTPRGVIGADRHLPNSRASPLMAKHESILRPTDGFVEPSGASNTMMSICTVPRDHLVLSWTKASP
jgi:hypothetical protein